MTTPTVAARPSRRSERPGRFAVAPPRRRRGEETLERFVEATCALLEERTFEQVSVQDIVARAGRPIGSFYARFAGKEALLPCLYERYDRELEARFDAWLSREDWDSLPLPETARRVVRGLLGMYVEQRWLLRAMAIFAQTTPTAVPPAVLERRERLFGRVAAVFARHHARLTHPDPAGAVRFGLFAVMSVARERLLFGEAPPARVTPIHDEALEHELVLLLTSYLAGAGAPAPRPSRSSDAHPSVSAR